MLRDASDYHGHHLQVGNCVLDHWLCGLAIQVASGWHFWMAILNGTQAGQDRTGPLLVADLPCQNPAWTRFCQFAPNRCMPKYC